MMLSEVHVCLAESILARKSKEEGLRGVLLLMVTRVVGGSVTRMEKLLVNEVLAFGTAKQRTPSCRSVGFHQLRASAFKYFIPMFAYYSDIVMFFVLLINNLHRMSMGLHKTASLQSHDGVNGGLFFPVNPS